VLVGYGGMRGSGVVDSVEGSTVVEKIVRENQQGQGRGRMKARGDVNSCRSNREGRKCWERERERERERVREIEGERERERESKIMIKALKRGGPPAKSVWAAVAATVKAPGIGCNAHAHTFTL
jgi:hypothetical protein